MIRKYAPKKGGYPSSSRLVTNLAPPPAEDRRGQVGDQNEIEDSGLPKHLPIGVNAQGQGPEDDATTHHYVCWCRDAGCAWNKALAANVRRGRVAALWGNGLEE